MAKMNGHTVSNSQKETIKNVLDGIEKEAMSVRVRILTSLCKGSGSGL